MTTLVGDKLNYLGSRILNLVEDAGKFTLFSRQTWHWFIHAPAKWSRPSLMLPQLFMMGTQSAPVVMLVGAFVGMVLSVETYAQFAAIGQETRLGGVINISVVKQIGPVLAAVMLAGRVGGSVSAELGTMRVTEQIDALVTLRTDPFRWLVAPRLLAAVLVMPALVLVSNALGVMGGWLLATQRLGFNSAQYLATTARYLQMDDVVSSLVKAAVFGFFIALMGCYHGYHSGGGAAGVGRATTNAVVSSFILILLSNLIITVIVFGS